MGLLFQFLWGFLIQGGKRLLLNGRNLQSTKYPHLTCSREELRAFGGNATLTGVEKGGTKPTPCIEWSGCVQVPFNP